MCLLDGSPVAAIAPSQDPGTDTYWWNVYFAADDLNATMKLISDNGGTTVVAPMDIMGQGRMAVFLDPSGASFGSWQKGEFHGAGVVNEPGSLAWNELLTHDVEGAKAFYGEVFGLATTVSEVAGEIAYAEWQVDGATVAGMMSLDVPQFPADVPSHWMTYFAVDDIDGSVARVTSLGGSVSVPPTEIPVGKFAVVADPQGAFFSLIQMA
jgi:uncharacterized protein